MLEIVDLVVTLGGRRALDGVSLRVGAGEIVGLIGPPEAGKTVLVKAVAGLLPVSRGAVRFGGEQVRPAPEARTQAWQNRIGMSFQNDALFDAMTVSENVAFPLVRRGVLEAERAARVRERLAAVGLWEARDKMPDEISGGMRKRCGIARATVGAPELALFDDPTAGLDPVSSATILDLIVSLREARRLPIIVVSNDLPVLVPVCDRIVMLHRGGVSFDGTPEALRRASRPEVAQFIRGGEDGPL